QRVPGRSENEHARHPEQERQRPAAARALSESVAVVSSAAPLAQPLLDTGEEVGRLVVVGVADATDELERLHELRVLLAELRVGGERRLKLRLARGVEVVFERLAEKLTRVVGGHHASASSSRAGSG